MSVTPTPTLTLSHAVLYAFFFFSFQILTVPIFRTLHDARRPYDSPSSLRIHSFNLAWGQWRATIAVWSFPIQLHASPSNLSTFITWHLHPLANFFSAFHLYFLFGFFFFLVIRSYFLSFFFVFRLLGATIAKSNCVTRGQLWRVWS